jgi:hypothetical protein
MDERAEQGRRKAGRPPADEPLSWRAVVRLPAPLGKQVERLAADFGVPVAIMLRMLVRSGLEAMDGTDDGHGGRARR